MKIISFDLLRKGSEFLHILFSSRITQKYFIFITSYRRNYSNYRCFLILLCVFELAKYKHNLFPQTQLALCHYTTSYSEENFSMANEFRPERWLRKDNLDRVDNFGSIPFGYGIRSCIGKRIAELEIHLALIQVRTMWQLYKKKIILVWFFSMCVPFLDILQCSKTLLWSVV